MMTKLFCSHANYRNEYSPLHGQPLPSMTWKAAWPPAVQLYLEFAAEVVFGSSYDAHKKLALKNRKSCEEALTKYEGPAEGAHSRSARPTLSLTLSPTLSPCW